MGRLCEFALPAASLCLELMCVITQWLSFAPNSRMKMGARLEWGRIRKHRPHPDLPPLPGEGVDR